MVFDKKNAPSITEVALKIINIDTNIDLKWIEIHRLYKNR